MIASVSGTPVVRRCELSEDNVGVDVQDNSREKAMAELLGLSTTGKRNGFDAVDSVGNPYELKTTSVRDVGTGRDVGRVWIEKIRAGYFVAAKTDTSVKSEWKPSEVIFCHPSDLEEWIAEKLESRISVDEELRDRILETLGDEVSQDEKARIEYLMGRGMTYNNPKISWEYLLSHGVVLDLNRPAEHLAELVSSRPLQ